MDRPDWVPAPAWGRLQAALRAQPAHASDVLVELQAATSRWDEATRARLVERFLNGAERGLPLPAAFISALADLLPADD